MIMILLRSITPTVPLVMLEAVKMMAAVCLVPPDGHDKVMLISECRIKLEIGG
jgi:diaphanous 2